MNRLARLVGGMFLVIVGIYLHNASWLAPQPAHGPLLLSHRGVHQTYHRDGLTNETCTAERIHPPTHTFLENTLPSIEAAFEYGADMIEIDIHATTDGEFAVFHDWTVDCRTNGRGRTIDHSMEDLRALDIGYGYTADGGETFPFRGQGIGMVPTLEEVLTTFPEGRFFLNAKSNRPDDAKLLSAYLAKLDIPYAQIDAILAGPRWVDQWRTLGMTIPATNRKEAKTCALSYLLWGWSGYVPKACAGAGIGVPLDLKRLYWGWPHRLQQRADAVSPLGVIVTGKLQSIGGGTGGVDTLEDLAELPDGYAGWVNTNRIELIGPAVHDTADR